MTSHANSSSSTACTKGAVPVTGGVSCSYVKTGSGACEPATWNCGDDASGNPVTVECGDGSSGGAAAKTCLSGPKNNYGQGPVL
jgi:hypothetical protein